MGIGDNKSGLVGIMEWTSVLVIILRIPKKQNKTKKQLNKSRKTKRESRATKDHVTKYAVSFHPSEIKTTN